MDITKLTDTELKALAFDEMNLAELHKNNFTHIRQELAKRQKQKQEVSNGDSTTTN